MKKIVFFNYAHKGDVFISRPFVEHIMQTINVKYEYAHYWENYLLKDLNLEYITLDQIPVVQSNNEHANNFVKDDIVYINTWIGKYFSHSKPRYGQCNLISTYELMYTEIFNFLSSLFAIDLKLKDILEYVPRIDYSHFNILSVDKFLKEEQRKKVLLCNGKCLSGQCEYNGTLDETIIKFSEKYPNIFFIITHKINFSAENVKYTGDIIDSNIEGLNNGQVNNYIQDINEISYLSKFCDIIVGRSSGPFTFCNTKDNIFDATKSFLCFGEKETDCLPYQLNVECEFIFEQFSTLESLENTIIDLIENEKTI